MKIAIVASLLVPVPPDQGGGAEQIINELAHGLAKRGHSITVFCAGRSTLSGKNIKSVECSPYPTLEHIGENRKWEVAQFRTLIERQSEFDIIHFNYEPVVFHIKQDGADINLLDSFEKPVACTFHNITTVAETTEYYRSSPSLFRHTMIFVSEKQRNNVSFFTNTRVIYNAIPLKHFPVEERKENYLLFLGRITPVKGILESIQVARKSNIPLKIVAGMGPADREFYESEVESQIDGDFIKYIGSLNFTKKINYLKKARCLLFPILWEEPFGLVMIEALACGTPVVAFRRGSVPEIIQDGVNGFIVDNVDEMVEAVKKVAMISPAKCRESVEKLFSVERMIDEYEDLFNKISVK